jgi:hypothetical protein
MVTVKLVKKNGKLGYIDNKAKLKYEIFIDKIKDGQIIDMYLDIADADHSLAQLAKVHACIRELAKESGYTFEEMKDLIKDASGLKGKSFAEASKDDLMLAIEACIQIGRDTYNINLG